MTLSHRLYVGTIGEGLWRSTDGGAKFVRACDGMFVECHVRALAVHPRDPRVLLLGSESGLYRSDDGAGNWHRVDSPVNGLQVWSVLLLPHDPDTVLVGTCPSRLFRSGDGGRTWAEARADIVQDCARIMHTRVTALAADPTDPDTVWAGVEIDGLRRSRDRGRTWQRVGRGLSSQDIHGLALVPPTPDPSPTRGEGGEALPPSPLVGEGSGVGAVRLLASTNNDLNASSDGGETWQPLGIGGVLPWPYCRGLAQMCGRPEVIFLGNGDGPPGTVGAVARSTDGGVSWREERMPGRANSTVWTFAVHPADPALVYAASVSGQVYRSADGGAAWEQLPREFGEIRAWRGRQTWTLLPGRAGKL